MRVIYRHSNYLQNQFYSLFGFFDQKPSYKFLCQIHKCFLFYLDPPIHLFHYDIFLCSVFPPAHPPSTICSKISASSPFLLCRFPIRHFQLHLAPHFITILAASALQSTLQSSTEFGSYFSSSSSCQSYLVAYSNYPS